MAPFDFSSDLLGGVGLAAAGMDRPAYLNQKRKFSFSRDSGLDQCVLLDNVGIYCGQAECEYGILDLNGSVQKRTCIADPLADFFTPRFDSGAQGWPGTYGGLGDNIGFSSTPIHLTSNAGRHCHEHQPLADPLLYAVESDNHGMYAGVEMGRAGSISPPATGTIFSSKNSALDDSPSYYGSHDLSRAESLHDTTGTMLEIQDPFSCEPSRGVGSSFSSVDATEALNGRENVLATYTEPLSYVPNGQFTGIYVNEEPWSTVVSHHVSSEFYQKPSMQPWPRAVPCDSSDNISQQRANSATCHLSEISSRRSNGSWPSSSRTMVDPSAELRSKFRSNSGGPLVDAGLVSSTNQNLSDPLMEYPQNDWDSLLTPFNLSDLDQPLDPPWNHIDITCQFDSSSKDSLFLDRPELGVDELSITAVRGHSIPPSDIQDEGPILSTSPRQNSNHRKWENIIFPPGYAQRLGGKKVEKESKQKVGCRRGPLRPESAKKAQDMRRLGACWHCWLFKVTCSPGVECERCKNSSSPLAFRICNRARLADYTEVFFPAVIASRRETSTVNDNIEKFRDNQVEVHLSSGPWYPPIKVLVQEFIPKNEELLAMDFITPNVNTPSQRLERRYTPPLAIFGLDVHQLKDECRDHIKQIIKQSQSPGKAKSSATARLCWEVYEAVNRYRKLGSMTGNSGLLRRVMMLHAMHYCMSRILTFTKDSADIAISSICRPMKVPYAKSMTSKVLNAQIKCVMNTLLHDVTREVLEGLEKELRTRTKASWATSFCVILILCICMEAVQVDTDGYIVQNIVNGNARANHAMTRDAAIEVCRSLDDLPFKHCTDLFHGIHRTRKPKAGHRNERGFNPIRDGIDLDEKEGLNSATVQLVDDIRKIIVDYGEELDYKARNLSFAYSPDLLAEHMRFRAQNSGRLVATFLRTFREEG